MKSVRLPKSAVKTSIVRHDEHADQHQHHLDPMCPICAVDIGTKSPEGVKESYAVTPCGHVFGNVCIKKYLAITDKPLCPVCRTDLFHACSHPVLPSAYDPKKTRLSRDEAAAKAFPDELRHTDCKFCRHRKIKYARRMRRQAMLEAAARKGIASTSASGSGSGSASGSGSGSNRSGSGSSEGGDSDDSENSREQEEVSSPGRAGRGLRKIKVPHEDEGSSGSSGRSSSSNSNSNSGEEDDGELEGDIILPDSPRLSANRSLPPIPGAYGHWDLANKGPDWKFLGWYDQQDPKMKTTPEQFA